MSARHHAEWLSLLEISGPFLSMPVLLHVFPQGLEADDPDSRRELRLAYEEWRDNQLGLQPETVIHRAWTRYVLIGTLELPDKVITEGQAIPQNLKATVTEHGETYHEHRRQLMLDRQEGLTKTYNRFHDPDESAEDIQRLRELHVEIDWAVVAAYGWEDLELCHDFHETPQAIRYTISEEARREVLGQLLTLNHERYEAEVKAGLHDKKRGKRRSKK